MRVNLFCIQALSLLFIGMTFQSTKSQLLCVFNLILSFQVASGRILVTAQLLSGYSGTNLDFMCSFNIVYM